MKSIRRPWSKTLKQSNLFRNVVTKQSGDWELTTTIVAHGQGDGLDYRSAMVVEYRIVDTATKKEIWKKGFNSPPRSHGVSGFFRCSSYHESPGRQCEKEFTTIHFPVWPQPNCNQGRLSVVPLY